MERLIRAILMRFGGAAFTLLLALFLARTVGAHGSGEYYYTFSAIIVVSQIVRLGLDNVILRDACRYCATRQTGNMSALSADILTFVTIVGAVAVGIGFALEKVVSPIVFGQGSIQYVVLLLSVVPNNLVWAYSSALKGVGKVGVSVFLEVGIVPFLVLFTLVSGQALDIPANPLWALLGAMVASAIVAVVCGIRALGFSPRFAGCIARMCRMFADSANSIGVVISNNLIVWAPLLLLGLLAGPRDVGIYNASFRVTMLIGAFSSVFKGLVAPQLAATHQKQSEMKRLLLKQTFQIGIFLVLTVIVALFAMDIVFSAFGPEFAEAKHLADIMLVGQFANVLTIAAETALIILNRNDILMRNAIFTAVVPLPICGALIYVAGAYGAALGFVLINVTSRAMILLVLRRDSLHGDGPHGP